MTEVIPSLSEQSISDGNHDEPVERGFSGETGFKVAQKSINKNYHNRMVSHKKSMVNSYMEWLFGWPYLSIAWKHQDNIPIQKDYSFSENFLLPRFLIYS